ncbi:MAG: homoserine kinase [Novosphingobium sp. 16-62-11]|uniref:homoserine kinase n=1 Tax=Novosphingobium sp. 17-62-19 TaxID=1970406 RepID=UPI000BCD7618|nr:homoserine kinase [Novosphingobium sp. 17-62-19]OYX92971.1 MAG: homoserine kinase [Novosphingobium sp. 35-62-5]OYZ27791.1 MAG: homoserine kinase [Novosphingobium sp. 16-62-11]OZA72744.1 MAG: homoserine kinase [Sphingomonadales bacterium 39-62-4]HQS98282.1 homoserine kinase [Novosphingobium sp.]OZA20630.1 MAG: homoserine kinase [Novosphingobium sp. 17-62-19]
MAVYTQIGAEEMAALVNEFDVGELVSAKGIAEGVSNSNWLLETTGKDGGGARFILTMYEFRIELEDLPYFLSLLDHLAAKGCPVPRTIHDREGGLYRKRGEKALALIEFLPGVSVSEPTEEQARAVGAALAQMHHAAGDFAGTRANGMGLAEWQRLFDACGADGLAIIDPALAGLVEEHLPKVAAGWPDNLPRSVIHADLFPDNVLMRGNKVSGLIDFYFACNDLMAYDVAVTHAAWCFDTSGQTFDADISRALLEGYEAVRPLLPEERAALPLLAQGAALRFTSSRAYDWLNTPADALVMRKDPMAFARRLEFYASNPEVFA